ncbi:MAG TPA: NUDIX hydrolase [Clostridiales bacterium]|nr:NUDIX hydrolase [Clostridiales bacterium]
MNSDKFIINGIKYSEKEYYEQHATEEEFLTWYKTLDLPKYSKPSVTVDNVILVRNEDTQKIKLLMIKRKSHPYKDCWALPGGFVDKNEDINAAAIREVKEETGVKIDIENIEQLHTFGTPNRDPRSWTISVAHIAWLTELTELTAGDDAKEVQWFEIDNISNPILIGDSGVSLMLDGVNIAFDHSDIIYKALQYINAQLSQ